MERITQIDLLVHPFFGLQLNERMPERRLNEFSDTYTVKEADLLISMWTDRIDQIKGDDKHALIFVSIDDGIKGDSFKKKYETQLLKYACGKLKKEQIFCFKNTLGGENLRQIKEGCIKEVLVYVYGEWIGSCCRGESELLSKKCGIPKKQFRPLPKLSVDRSGRYPPPWRELSAENMTRKDKEALRMQIKEYTKGWNDFKK